MKMIKTVYSILYYTVFFLLFALFLLPNILEFYVTGKMRLTGRILDVLDEIAITLHPDN